MTALSVSVMLSAANKSTIDDVQSFARHVESVGLDGVFVGDHLANAGPVLDSTIVLAVAAAATDRLNVGFGVMVLALRGPAWAAKQIATLQLLSGNRVILGVGAGGAMHGTSAWQAVGVPYAERGRFTDAALGDLHGLVTGEPVAVKSTDQLQLLPGADMPPVWIGGMGAAARRRAVEFGDAWFPSMLLADDVVTGRYHLSDSAVTLGRPEPAVALGGAALLGAAESHDALDGFTNALTTGYGIPPDRARRVPIVGGSAQAGERLAEYKEAGVSHLVLGLIGDDWRSQCDLIAKARTTVALVR